MAELTFSSYLQGPLGEAIQQPENLGALPVAAFAPAVKLDSTVAASETIAGPAMRLLGPGDIIGLSSAAVVRADPPNGATDSEPNYLAVVDVVPPELPWVLTPARAADGRLRPWLVLIVVEAATTVVQPGDPLATIEAEIAQLPDLRDSWGWAHVQRTDHPADVPGGALQAAVGRLMCPRHLASGVRYLACVVPAFSSGVAAGLGNPAAHDAPHDLAWHVDQPGRVRLPVYYSWTFTTGPQGDFEQLVTRLRPADSETLRVSSVRNIDVAAPWPVDTALASSPQVLGVQGALIPFSAPDKPPNAVSDTVLAAFDTRIRAHLDSPAHRLEPGAAATETGAVAPPIYGARHVSQPTVDVGPSWVSELNVAIANRIAAGLGADYVRANQEHLMASAWEQVGAIRAANRLRSMSELSAAVTERVHARHVAMLQPGELVAFAAPASERIRTSLATTLATETRMSVMVNGAATSAFARFVRPGGKLAQRTGVSVNRLVPRALVGEVSVVFPGPVVPNSPQPTGDAAVLSINAANQLIAMNSLANVAALNNDAVGGGALRTRVEGLQLNDEVTAAIRNGSTRILRAAIGPDVTSVADAWTQTRVDMAADQATFGAVTARGVKIATTALAERVLQAFRPGERYTARFESMVSLPSNVTVAGPSDPVMACPVFPVPTALALLDTDREWFMPGLGALPSNRVAVLRPNASFIESYLVGMNHEMMAELLWREYPTDRRGTPFRRFWPRADAENDIPPIATWTDATKLGGRLNLGDSITVLLVRGDVVRRYPGMIVTAVPSSFPDADGKHRPNPTVAETTPLFVIRIDESTMAYAFAIANVELQTPATAAAPGWFFVFAENGYRIRFGFDDPPDSNDPVEFTNWSDARWPSPDAAVQPAMVPVARDHAIAGAAFAGPNAAPGADVPAWNRDSADIARIVLQRPFRVAIQADVLLNLGAL